MIIDHESAGDREPAFDIARPLEEQGEELLEALQQRIGDLSLQGFERNPVTPPEITLVEASKVRIVRDQEMRRRPHQQLTVAELALLVAARMPPSVDDSLEVAITKLDVFQTRRGAVIVGLTPHEALNDEREAGRRELEGFTGIPVMPRSDPPHLALGYIRGLALGQVQGVRSALRQIALPPGQLQVGEAEMMIYDRDE